MSAAFAKSAADEAGLPSSGSAGSQRDTAPLRPHRATLDEFWLELMRVVDLVSTHPERFHFTDRGLRRANMSRFPYHLLFRQRSDVIRVIVVRHNRRHPDYGTARS